MIKKWISVMFNYPIIMIFQAKMTTVITKY